MGVDGSLLLISHVNLNGTRIGFCSAMKRICLEGCLGNKLVCKTMRLDYGLKITTPIGSSHNWEGLKYACLQHKLPTPHTNSVVGWDCELAHLITICEL